MTSSIVALSSADATVRAVVVALLSLLALAAIGTRIDWTQLRRDGRRPAPVYLRVDQRTGQTYRAPSPRRRIAAAGGLGGLVVVAGIAIALAVSILLSVLVGAITDLLR